MKRFLYEETRPLLLFLAVIFRVRFRFYFDRVGTHQTSRTAHERRWILDPQP